MHPGDAQRQPFSGQGCRQGRQDDSGIRLGSHSNRHQTQIGIRATVLKGKCTCKLNDKWLQTRPLVMAMGPTACDDVQLASLKVALQLVKAASNNILCLLAVEKV
jgi:hypothetical protein